MVQRGNCSIYVGSINFEVCEDAVKSLFLPFGPIKHIALQMDPSGLRSKGFCFIEFVHPESAESAIQEMNGFYFAGRQIKVNTTTPQTPGQVVAQQNASGLPMQTTQPMGVARMDCRIYVGAINWNLKEDDIKGLFEPFGKIRNCQMIPNPETGKHKGYGFIDFEKKESADEAIKAMNGFELMGLKIKVNYPTLTAIN
ncbi:MAG: putative poly-U-binding factor 60kDa [Streblomastix strix]|uniref:Putative poly-U-binding factor 60kDa n=1 Tax=Streblomastix strix TaxID=222440 RepID=A0A5J4W5P3_9EUKA|nr:MAG: putative poly-U-binding factor 60kDa [Streblomastix strix]